MSLVRCPECGSENVKHSALSLADDVEWLECQDCPNRECFDYGHSHLNSDWNGRNGRSVGTDS